MSMRNSSSILLVFPSRWRELNSCNTLASLQPFTFSASEEKRKQLAWLLPSSSVDLPACREQGLGSRAQRQLYPCGEEGKGKAKVLEWPSASHQATSNQNWYFIHSGHYLVFSFLFFSSINSSFSETGTLLWVIFTGFLKDPHISANSII